MLQINKLSGITTFVAVFLAAFSAASAQDRDLKHTVITPHMEVPIKAGENVVFCSTFQLAWNGMKNDIIGEDIRLEKPLGMVRLLNRGLSTAADVPPGDCVAMAGYGRDDIAARINRELLRKFGGRAPVVDEGYNHDDVILAYAFLFKEIRFARPFVAFNKPVTFYGKHGKTAVAAFGVDFYSDRKHRQLRKQAEIVEYHHGREFIVRLISEDPDDELILAQVPPEKTLLETVEKVAWRVARGRSHAARLGLEENDILQVPKVDLSVVHDYAALTGLYLLNAGFEDYFVYRAVQGINFRLDECGAAVRSAAEFALKKGPERFRALVFNRPFLLYLKSKNGRYPYLAVWVENAEVLETRPGI